MLSACFFHPFDRKLQPILCKTSLSNPTTRCPFLEPVNTVNKQPYITDYKPPSDVKTSLRILAASDFHGSIEASEKTARRARSASVDVLIVCGDITHFGSGKDAERILTPLIELKLPILYVLGNCDPAQLAEAQIRGAINLHGHCHSINDVSFVGIGGSPASPFYSWFELSEKQIANMLDLAVEHCSTNKWNVVVSHSPPRDTSVDQAFSKVHAGSIGLREFIVKRKPSIVFCGHIHEARGIDHIGDTIVVNPGPVRHGYCAVAELDSKIEVSLDSV